MESGTEVETSAVDGREPVAEAQFAACARTSVESGHGEAGAAADEEPRGLRAIGECARGKRLLKNMVECDHFLSLAQSAVMCIASSASCSSHCDVLHRCMK